MNIKTMTEGDEYSRLTPVIFIGVVDFTLFKSPEYLSHHLILNGKTYEHALSHLEFHFIELSKFNKPLEEISSIADKWIYLLKNASTMKTVPPCLQQPSALKDAFQILEQGN